MKKCNRCNLEKQLDLFRIHKKSTGGVYGICKNCELIIDRERRLKNPEKFRKSIDKYRLNNPEKVKESIRKYTDKNRNQINEKALVRSRSDKGKEQQRKWQKKNREHLRKWYKNKREIDPVARACHNVRNRMINFLKVKSNRFNKTLGCTKEEFRIYIESKFQSGMNWDNYGFYGWHIDHIYPISRAYEEGPEAFSRACHYTNLQPLWAKDNLSKSDKII